MLVEDLLSCSTFVDLDRLELKKLLQFSDLKRFSAGEVLFEKGRIQAGILLILKGEVHLQEPSAEDSDEPARVLEFMEVGDVIGETTLFGDAVPRPFRAVAHTDCQLLWVNSLDFRRLQNSAPMVLTKLLLRMIIDVSNDFRKRNGEFGTLRKELEGLQSADSF